MNVWKKLISIEIEIIVQSTISKTNSTVKLFLLYILTTTIKYCRNKTMLLEIRDVSVKYFCNVIG